jgi:3-deoxy-D-manno-octulosonate 8-phosphate phosphatase (KDO 8-P phosphatase)
MNSYKTILNQINTFIFDIDGVLTDGTVLLYNGEVIRSMNSKDSYALQYASKLGYSIFVITGGDSEEVKWRFEKAGVREVFLSSSNKVKVFHQLTQKHNIDPDRVLYMGDDIPDYELLKLVALPCCPQDSAIEIKQISKYVSPINGGKGCVRDVIEQTLRVQGKWMLPEAHEW